MSVSSRPVASFRTIPALPGDKSITHRAYLMAALAEGESRVLYGNRGRDCDATLAALGALGVRIRPEEGGGLRIIGHGGMFEVPPAPLDLGNSGTGLRLLLGVLAAHPFTVVLSGDASLRTRPMNRVLDPLRLMGARAEAPGGLPPVTLTGGPLRGISYRLPMPSAQVKSAILLAGIQAQGTTTVRGGLASRDHTERLLRWFDVPVETEEDEVSVAGPVRLRGNVVSVPADPSAGAFYLAAALVVPGSEVLLEGVSLNPSRTACFDVFRRMGLDLVLTDDDEPGPEPMGHVEAAAARNRAADIEPEEIPGLIDELPALAVAAAFAEGTTRVRGAGELRVKESDRLAAMAEGLAAIGARVRLLADGWEIEGSGGAPLPGGSVRSYGDHRVAMAFLIAGLGCRNGVTVLDEPQIETSDPYFLSNLNTIMETRS